MKKSLFRAGQNYFHINIDFIIHPIFKDLDWIFVQKKVQHALRSHEVHLHALVMMDTHLHLLVQSDHQKENFFCASLESLLKMPNQSIECHCEPVPTYAQYINAYKYIYRNPVEAGLSQRVEDYAYSSLRGLLGLGITYCEIIDYLGLIQNPIQHLNWMNNLQDFKFSKLSQFETNDFAKPIPN